MVWCGVVWCGVVWFVWYVVVVVLFCLSILGEGGGPFLKPFRGELRSISYFLGEKIIIWYEISLSVRGSTSMLLMTECCISQTKKTKERNKKPKSWIREGAEEEPVDFLDRKVVQRVVGK